MSVFGTTRSAVRQDHALITPASFVQAPLPGWERTQGVVLISPRMGAHFTQYLALMETGSISGAPAAGIERMIYVLEGHVRLKHATEEHALREGGFTFIPADLNVS